jgi:hypothetical protein
MPFKSKSQLRLCYNKKDPRWNCDEWLKKTDSLCCLPEKLGYPTKCRTVKKGEKIKGSIQTGPRGGKFFVITEKDKKGVLCEIKFYI